MKNRSGTYKIWPNPYLSKKRDYLVSAQLHINAGPNFTRNDRSKIKDYIYLCCKESSHIEKVGTEYKAWCDVKSKSIINEMDLFLESLTKSIFFLF